MVVWVRDYDYLDQEENTGCMKSGTNLNISLTTNKIY